MRGLFVFLKCRAHGKVWSEGDVWGTSHEDFQNRESQLNLWIPQIELCKSCVERS